jgi:predicted amidohydrolase YtcJ
MRTLYYNGTVYAMDEKGSRAEAVAVEDGMILELGGSQAMIEKYSQAEQIDLKGAAMFPGFTDSHMHMLAYASEQAWADLNRAHSKEEVLSRMRAAFAESEREGRAAEEWLVGAGWNQEEWDEPDYPVRADLDQISAETPIAMIRTCHHIAILNTAGLKRLGLTEEEMKANENIGRDADGRPDGRVCESALPLVYQAFSVPGKEGIKKRILLGCRDALKQGITCIHTDDFETFPGNCSEQIMEAYQELAQKGELPVRIVQQCLLRHPDVLAAFLERHHSRDRVGLYEIGPHKILLDGCLGTRTAYLREPYSDGEGKGATNYRKEELLELMRQSHERGEQLAIHAIGDGALEMILQCFEEIDRNVSPVAGRRHGIVHCQISTPDQLERAKKLGLLLYIQPIFVRADQHIAEARLGAERTAFSYGWKTMREMGLSVSGGSDCPVEAFDVMPNLACAVTRKDYGQENPESWMKDQCLTVDEALRLFTVDGAYVSFEEKERGTIEPGNKADFTVLAEDPYRTPADALKDIPVCLTIVDGKIRYRREGF